jgi:hypothetical protein
MLGGGSRSSARKQRRVSRMASTLDARHDEATGGSDNMSTDRTRQVINDYFHALRTGQFKQFFGETVTWTTIEDSSCVTGPDDVEAAINGLHARMSDTQTRQLLIVDNLVCLEGSAAGTRPDDDRICYCVTYELDGDRIIAMRAYGALAALMPKSQQPPGS